MNQRSQILQAIYDYLKERGKVATLYWSYRMGSPPIFTSPPCVAMTHDSRVVNLRLDGMTVRVMDADGELMSVDVNDPDMLDVVERYSDDCKATP